MQSSKASIKWVVLGHLKQTSFCRIQGREAGKVINKRLSTWIERHGHGFFYSLGRLRNSLRVFLGEARVGHTTVSMLNDCCDKGLLQDDSVIKNIDPCLVRLLIDNTKWRQELKHCDIP